MVEQEASLGSRGKSAARLRAIKPLNKLATSESAVVLAETLVRTRAVPEKAAAEALHIAIATVEKMDFLLSWNFKHIVNAQMQGKISKACNDEGYQAVFICSPEHWLEFK